MIWFPQSPPAETRTASLIRANQAFWVSQNDPWVITHFSNGQYLKTVTRSVKGKPGSILYNFTLPKIQMSLRNVTIWLVALTQGLQGRGTTHSFGHPQKGAPRAFGPLLQPGPLLTPHREGWLSEIMVGYHPKKTKKRRQSTHLSTSSFPPLSFVEAKSLKK